MYLIQHDVLSVEDADVAVSYGPGPRWGVMGPSMQWHLGGGAGGIKHFMDHLMDPLAAMIKNLWSSGHHARAQANDRRRSATRSGQTSGQRTRARRERIANGTPSLARRGNQQRTYTTTETRSGVSKEKKVMNQTQSITTPPNISRHHEQVGGYQTSSVSGGLTKTLESKLNAPAFHQHRGQRAACAPLACAPLAFAKHARAAGPSARTVRFRESAACA